jgi:aryl sulfotransferase
VMLLHFSNLKRDMPGEIRRTAAFLDIVIDETKWDSILEHCSFNYMKAHAAQSVPFGGSIYKGGAETFMHKGANGNWREKLTPVDIEHYEQTANEKLGADCAFWLSTGTLQQIENTKSIPLFY